MTLGVINNTRWSFLFLQRHKFWRFLPYIVVDSDLDQISLSCLTSLFFIKVLSVGSFTTDI